MQRYLNGLAILNASRSRRQRREGGKMASKRRYVSLMIPVYVIQ